MSNALHISLTDFQNQSRLLKETASLTDGGLFEHIGISALQKNDLPEIERVSPSVTAHRHPLATRALGNSIVAKVLMYVEFCARVYLRHRRSNIRCVNVHSFGLLPLGVVLARVWSASLVYDAHELETESNGLVGRRQALAKRIERSLIGRCDLVIVVSESIAEWYENEYPIARPAVVMNVPRRRTVERTRLLAETLGIPEGTHIALYQGLLTTGRGVERTLRVFRECPPANFVLVIMGYGPFEEAVRAAEAEGAPVRYLPAVPPERVLEHTASADVGIALIENTCLSYYYSLPNKVFEYAMAGVPVVVHATKELERFVRSTGIGLVVEEDDRALARAFERLVADDFEGYRRRAREAAEACAWEVQEAKMLDAYRQAGIGASS